MSLIRIELRAFPNSSTLLLSPSRRMYQIDASPEEVEAFLSACDGHPSPDEILQDTQDPTGFAKVLRILEQDGFIYKDKVVPRGKDWVRFRKVSRPEHLATTQVFAVGDALLINLLHQQGFSDLFANFASCTLGELDSISQRGNVENLVIIAIRDHFDLEFLLELNDFCDERNIRWSQFHFENERGWIGPSVNPGCSPNYRDLLGRRLAAVESVEIFQALVNPTEYGGNYLPPLPELVWMLSYFSTDLTRWIAGTTCQTVCHELEADPVNLNIIPHPILPLPDRDLDIQSLQNLLDESGVIIDIDFLVDERTGLITHIQEIEHSQGVPEELETVQVHVGAMDRICPWANNQICGGSSFGALEDARLAAIGEGVERYCGNWILPTKVINSTYDELVGIGDHAVDPEQLVLYSNHQYETNGFPFVPFTRDRLVHWVRGRSLTRNCPAWLPCSLVYVNWYTDQFATDVPTNYLYYPGIAAGPDVDTAITAGLEEIIERDATMIWWMNAYPLPSFSLTPDLVELWKDKLADFGQRAWLIHLDNEFGVPVVAGVVENVKEQLMNIGFAARPTPEEAALKAWSEALTLQEGSRDLLDRDSLFQQAVARGMMVGKYHKPWRADRAYLDDFRSDFRDVCDLMVQQQVFLDPRAQEFVRSWVDVSETRPFDTLTRLRDRSLVSYQKRVEDRGYEIFYVDVTTQDIELAGLRVVRTVVPGLVPNAPAAFPFLGKRRIQDQPVQLGWRTEALEEDELNYFPMPHA